MFCHNYGSKDRHQPMILGYNQQDHPQLLSRHCYSVFLPASKSPSKDSVTTSALPVSLHYPCYSHSHGDKVTTRGQVSGGLFSFTGQVQNSLPVTPLSKLSSLLCNAERDKKHRTSMVMWSGHVLQTLPTLNLPDSRLCRSSLQIADF